MTELAGLLPLALVMLVTGLAGGVIAGLLGVGGGIVIVPALELALTAVGVDAAVRMHVAVATSMATIIPTSLASARAHHQRGAVDVPLVWRWSAPILLGALASSLLAARVASAVLTAVFGVVALAVALRMFLPIDDRHVAREVPRSVWALPIPALIGMVSAMMGIGGG